MLTAACASAQAAERVTLNNGFALTCHHHEADGDRTRLYTTPDNSSYIEIESARITGVEAVPDPPPPPEIDSAGVPPKPAPDLPQILSTAGSRHNIDVDLLASVVKAESGGNPRARSRVGAQGLMQLMPGTAAELGVQDSFEPEQNVGGGSSYLDALLTRYHDDLQLALAAYNAGPAAVDKYHGIPPYRETQLYVARVIREFNRRVRAHEKAERASLSSGTR